MTEIITTRSINGVPAMGGDNYSHRRRRIRDKRIGISPLPVFVITVTIIAACVAMGKVPEDLRREHGTYRIRQFFAGVVVYPLLLAIDVAKISWEKLVSAFSFGEITTLVASNATLVGTGFAVEHLVDIYPIETAILAACPAGQGSNGDVAILCAFNGSAVMPFTKVVTTIGGAIAVLPALALFAKLGLTWETA